MKLRGNRELALHGLASEMLASLLARDIEIPVMPPLVISMDAAFTKTIPDPDLRQIGQQSIGLNFGTAKWSSGFTMWTRGFQASEDVRRTLSEILVFDCVIENPDRTAQNPNCVFRGEEVIAFDHDLAFSSLLSVGAAAPSDSWQIGFLGDHAFRSTLVRAVGFTNRLRLALRQVSDRRIEEYLLAVPPCWIPSSEIRNGMLRILCHNVANFDSLAAKLEAL